MAQDAISRAFELMDSGMYESAKQELDKIQFENQSIENKFVFLNTYGYVLCGLKNYHAADSLYQRYKQLANDNQNMLQLHIAYHQLAMVQRLSNNFERAFAYLEKERQILTQYFPEDKLKLSVYEYEIGYIHLLSNQYDKAMEYMRLSLNNALKTDDLIARACAYRGLGEIQQKIGNRLEAKDYFTSAIDLFEEAGDIMGSNEVKSYINKL